MRVVPFLLFLFVLALPGSFFFGCLMGCNGTTASNSAGLDKETRAIKFLAEMRKKFDSPDIGRRPEIRWWMAQGLHSDETLINSVHELYDAGFRSIEILDLQDPSIDTSVYGWGSDQWSHDISIILAEAANLGMGVGFTSGCSWMPAVPGLDPDSEAALQELNFTWETVPAGKSHTGLLAFPETPNVISRIDLVRVIAARIAGNQNANTGISKKENSTGLKIGDAAPVFEHGKNPIMSEFSEMRQAEKVDTTYLADGTLTDITDLVEHTKEGFTLKWKAPADGNWIVFAFWNHGSGQAGESSAEKSYIINHFSSEGPLAQMKYWDDHIFTKENLSLFDDLNNVDFFQDSLEISTSTRSKIFWCADFLNEFKKRRGYDLSLYLPLIIVKNASISADSTFTDPWYAIDGKEDLAKKVRNDLFQTLTDLYMDEYLIPIREWLNGYGVNLRSQVSYGQTLEVSLPATVVDIPETETLAMFSVLDGYRMHAGTVHLYGKKFFSSETGAVFFESYCKSLQEYLELMNTQFAAGVNRTIFHGYASISGPEGNTSWPGYDGGRKIGFVVSERWGKRMPYWRDIQYYTAYLARLQAVLQAGVQKTDVGIVNLQYTAGNLDGWVNHSGHEITEGYFMTDLNMQKKGYTYEYFAPQIMKNKEVFFFKNGALNPDGPAYQAVLLYQDGMPLDSARALLDQAKKGLPIVMLSNVGTTTVSAADSEESLYAVFSEIKELDNVRVADSEEEVVSKLQSLGVFPRVAYHDQADLLSVLRNQDDTKYLYIYNRGGQDVSTDVSILGIAVPYRLDPWTGQVETVCLYRHENGQTIIPVNIASKDTAVYIMDTDAQASVHAVSSNAHKVFSTKEGIYIRALKSGDYATTLSNGRLVKSDVIVPDVVELADWTLCVESWEAGEKKSSSRTFNGVVSTEVTYETIKRLLPPVVLTELVPWKDIDGIGPDVSGIGTYNVSFTLPDDQHFDGAYLDLGILYQSARIRVNGMDINEINLSNPVVEITNGLRKGENTLSIDVTSTLANRLVSYGKYPESHITDYGLLGAVAVFPFVDRKIY